MSRTRSALRWFAMHAALSSASLGCAAADASHQAADQDAATGDAANDTAPAPGVFYGVFVGLDLYKNAEPLEHVADDTRALVTAFEDRGVLQASNAIVLTDSQATAKRLADALLTMSQRVTAADTLMLFYGGHGDMDRISLYSSDVEERGLRRYLDAIRGELILVVDSCHSGSLAGLVSGQPRRVGFFSSASDEVSYVASSVHAGGWLEHELIRAVRETPLASDGSMSVSDLAVFLKVAYEKEVGEYQHLVIETGIDSSDDLLWRERARMVRGDGNER